MNAVAKDHYSKGFWRLAWQRFAIDRVGMASLFIVVFFLAIVFLSATGLIASDWNKEIAINDAPPNLWGLLTQPEVSAPESYLAHPPTGQPVTESQNIPTAVIDPLADALASLGASSKTTIAQKKASSLPLGGDRWGRDVLMKTIKGTQTSLFVGLTAALLATFLGTLLGALAGYYGGYADDILNWIYSVFNSIPYLLLILAVAAVLQQRGIATVVLILGLTGWTGVFRLIRAEYIKHRSREYVMAAHAFGVPSWRILLIHILPNVSHIVLVEISILAVAFIKSEVILSFLGFGVAVDEVSWGSMLNDAQSELILGRWWELTAAGGAMAILVTAFSLFTDAMRDALDPKIKGMRT